MYASLRTVKSYDLSRNEITVFNKNNHNLYKKCSHVSVS